MSDLEHYLNEMTEDQAQKIIQKGRAYLASESGTEHSYEGMAALMFQKIARQFSFEPSHQ